MTTCTADDNKRKALNLMAALVGKTFPDDIITDLLANSATNADQLPLIDLFRNAGLDDVVLADKILESLASGTNAVTSRYLKTTAQFGSCNQASNTTSQINQLVYNIAYPTE
jgi:hypothetical protein